MVSAASTYRDPKALFYNLYGQPERVVGGKVGN